jgi:isoquinoline 1-oxidoreductase alpha subunit
MPGARSVDRCGFLLAARALLADEPTPSREQIVETLSGNLCRCGWYGRIVDAVTDAAEGFVGGVGRAAAKAR